MRTRRSNGSALGDSLRRARRVLSLSQDDVADLLGSHVNSVRLWESGAHPRGANVRNVDIFLSALEKLRGLRTPLKKRITTDPAEAWALVCAAWLGFTVEKGSRK